MVEAASWGAGESGREPGAPRDDISLLQIEFSLLSSKSWKGEQRWDSMLYVRIIVLLHMTPAVDFDKSLDPTAHGTTEVKVFDPLPDLTVINTPGLCDP